MVRPSMLAGVITGESLRSVLVTVAFNFSARASIGFVSAPTMSYIKADCAPVGALLMWKVICRFGSGVAFATYQICGSWSSGAYLTQMLPAVSVMEVVGITDACGVVRTKRLPTEGNCTVQTFTPVKLLSDEMFWRTMRIPSGEGAVPAKAAFSATETAL